MKKAKLEVIRFGAEDVIATSGGAALTGSYFTILSEAAEGRSKIGNYSDTSVTKSFVALSFTEGTNYPTIAGDYDQIGEKCIYVWYDTDYWRTNQAPGTSSNPTSYDVDGNGTQRWARPLWGTYSWMDNQS